MYIYTVIIHHFRNDEEVGAKMPCVQYCFWDHSWGLPGQLLANFSGIFRTLVIKFLACLPLLGFSNV